MTLFNRAVAATLPLVPKTIVHRIAQRYIAGETIDGAIALALKLNARGFRTTMDMLGEHVSTLAQAQHAVETYLTLLDRIQSTRVNGNVSLKLTQFGLKIDKRACRDLVATVVRRAGDLGNFVRLDMENSSCTTDTFEVYRSLREDFANVGAVMQAYLRRSVSDLEALADLKPSFRLCKGVYREPRRIAFQEMDVINRNYVLLLERLLRQGSYVGIATHDERIVWEALRLIAERKLDTSGYEFQMLLGVDEELRDLILEAGHPVRIYIPFGHDWYAYSVRRLHENPQIAGHVLRAFLKG